MCSIRPLRFVAAGKGASLLLGTSDSALLPSRPSQRAHLATGRVAVIIGPRRSDRAVGFGPGPLYTKAPPSSGTCHLFSGRLVLRGTGSALGSLDGMLLRTREMPKVSVSSVWPGQTTPPQRNPRVPRPLRVQRDSSRWRRCWKGECDTAQVLIA